MRNILELQTPSTDLKRLVMTRKPLIECVSDNDDKKFTYTVTIGRLEDATHSGFYLEALLIEGALIEDRIRSYLFHLGVFELRESREANADIAQKLVEMPGAKGDKKLLEGRHSRSRNRSHQCNC